MFVSNLASTTTLDGSALKIGIVQARFNDDITNALATACIAELKAMGVADDRITHVHVPGALEVPWPWPHSRKLKTQNHSAP